MMLEWCLAGLAIATGLLGSALFSGAETGLYCVNRLRVFLGVQRGDPRSKRIARLIDDERGALSVMLAGTNLMNYICTTVVAYMFGSLMELGRVDIQVYTVLLLTPVVFVFGEVVPKNIFQLHADVLMPRFSRPLSLANRIFRVVGLVWFMKSMTTTAARLCGAAAVERRVGAPKHRVVALLHEALSGRMLGEEQSELIDRVCRLSETPVRAVMIPYHRVTMIAADADRDALVRVARATDYARVPVHGSRRSQIMGLVKIDDLLRSDDWRTVGERITPVITLRPLDTVATAITRMQRVRKEMAIVTGFSGGLLGVVTLRDLLDEIAGEVATAEAA